jgi:hypothetical protein
LLSERIVAGRADFPEDAGPNAMKLIDSPESLRKEKDT